VLIGCSVWVNLSWFPDPFFRFCGSFFARFSSDLFDRAEYW
jgi:hypothetical protein